MDCPYCHSENVISIPNGHQCLDCGAFFEGEE